MGREEGCCRYSGYGGDVLGAERGEGGACREGPGGWLCVRGRKIGALGLKLGRERGGKWLRYVSNEKNESKYWDTHTFRLSNGF